MRLLVEALLLGAVLSCGTSVKSPTSPLARNPLPKHWVLAHVVLAEPLPINGGPDVVVGYYQTFGVACAPNSVRELVERQVQDGTIDWADSEVSPVDPARLDPEVLSLALPLAGPGVWYSSGRSFHGAE
jgi:hypothetical protein